MLTQQEKERLELYSTYATFTREQVADYFDLLTKSAEVGEQKPLEVEAPKKRGRKPKMV